MKSENLVKGDYYRAPLDYDRAEFLHFENNYAVFEGRFFFHGSTLSMIVRFELCDSLFNLIEPYDSELTDYEKEHQRYIRMNWFQKLIYILTGK